VLGEQDAHPGLSALPLTRLRLVFWYSMDEEDRRELIERARVLSALSRRLIERAETTMAASEELVQTANDLARANEALRQWIGSMNGSDGGG
jgi:hypothetical protein